MGLSLFFRIFYCGCLQRDMSYPDRATPRGGNSLCVQHFFCASRAGPKGACYPQRGCTTHAAFLSSSIFLWPMRPAPRGSAIRRECTTRAAPRGHFSTPFGNQEINLTFNRFALKKSNTLLRLRLHLRSPLQRGSDFNQYKNTNISNL